MSGTRERFNAVFLAAVMVLSMVAFSTAFAGGAAAVSGGSGGFTIDNVDQSVNTTNDQSDLTVDTNITDAGGTPEAVFINNTNELNLNTVDSVEVSNESGANITDSIPFQSADSVQVNLTDAGSTSISDGDAINITVSNITNSDTPSTGDLDVNFTDLAGSSTTQTSTNGVTIAPSLVIADSDFPLSASNQTDVDASLTVENQGAQDTSADIFFNQTGDGDGSAQNLDSSIDQSIASGSSTTFTTTINTGNLNGVNVVDAANETVLSGNVTDNGTSVEESSVSSTLTVGTDSSGIITAEITDQNGNAVSDVDVEVYESSSFVSVDNPGAVVAGPTTPDSNGDVRFSDLAVGGDETNSEDYVVVAGADSSTFGSSTSTANLFEPGQTQDGPLGITVNRLIDPDDITVDPSSETVALDATVNTTTNVTTDDRVGITGSPLEDSPVSVTVDNIDDPSGQLATGDVTVSPASPQNTRADGKAFFDVSLDLSGADEDAFQDNVNVDLTYTADDNTSVTAPQNLTFTPDVRGTATISGQVDEVVGQDSQLGVEANTVEPAEGAQVHAVRYDNIQANTLTIENVNEEEIYRIGTYDSADLFDTADVRSDYLTTTQDVEITQNETSLGFNVDNVNTSGDQNVSIHFLSNASYQVQKYNTTTGSFQNASSVTGPNGNDLSGSSLFDVTGDELTYNAVSERFADDPFVPNSTVNSVGDFELLNVPANESTGTQYVVIAGGSNTGDSDTQFGYANFAGYEIVNVRPNAIVGSDGTNVDLSVQEFERDVFFSYDLDVVAEDENEELVKSVETETGTEVDAVINVSATNLETGENSPDAADGQQINLSLIGDSVGSIDDSVTVDQQFADGQQYATATFEASDTSAGTVNVSAETTNDAGDEYNTSAQGVGLNDVSNQAEINVFTTIEITGDVVNEFDTNIPGAQVELFSLDATGNLNESLDNTTSGSGGSYVFTGVQTGQELAITATALDADGNEVENTRILNDRSTVDTSLGGEDVVIEGAVEDQPLEDADFQVSGLSAPSEVNTSESLTVTATVTNDGAIEDTQDVTFRLNSTTPLDDGAVVDTSSVTLASGQSDTVEFDVTASADAGDYTHGVFTEQDDQTADLTVSAEEDNSGDDNFSDQDFNQEQYNAVFGDDGTQTQDELSNASNTWFNSDDNTVNGVTISQDELSALINYWFEL